MRAADINPNAPLVLKLSVRISFAVATACYLATGAMALAVAGYFKGSKDSSRRTVIVTNNVLNTLLATGAYIVASALAGVFGSLAPLTRKRWLIAYTAMLIVAVLVETCIGIWLWSRTLDAHDLYAHNWRNLWPNEVKRIYQDKSGCCGYLNPHDSPAPGSPACDASTTTFGCMISVQEYAQNYLTYVYTWLFIFVVVDVAALLAVMVLLAIRNDEERLRWSRANSIFRSMKKAQSGITLHITEPKPTH
ncbi:hypothetical protein H4S01_002661 [Coemansia sp. RSA 2610]|nr:hypothetical protein H4S01_002661 [Coemansia sp. RSA 2610]